MQSIPQRSPRHARNANLPPRIYLDAADRAIYRPSGQYKQSFLGRVVQGIDAYKCPKASQEQSSPQDLLRDAIRQRNIGGDLIHDFPELVWVHQKNGLAFEARMFQGEPGTYYGYPISASQLPSEMQ